MLGADRIRILTGATKHQVRWLTDREHVATSPRELIRIFRDRLPASERGIAKRAIRHAVYRYALLVLERNRATYRRYS
jgi:hypothetical protein